LPPLWTTHCGEGDNVQSQAFTNVSIAPCDTTIPMADAGAATTAIQIFPIMALPPAPLGAPVCTVTATPDDAGVVPDGGVVSVTRFDVLPVLPVGSALQPQLGLPCPTPAPAIYKQGILPGTQYEFTLQAYEGNAASPSLKALCFAWPLEGLTVNAMCDTLTPF
jgi:hypothetical protein